jgi:hypothetical protein
MATSRAAATHTVVEIPGSVDSESRKWEVKTTSVYVQGYVEQFKPVPGEEHPFKAFARPHARAPFKMLSVFYESEHGGAKKAFDKALQAVLSCSM